MGEEESTTRGAGAAREEGDKGDTRRGMEEGGAVEEPTREVGESGLGADKGAGRGEEEGGAVEEPTREVGERGLEADTGSSGGTDGGTGGGEAGRVEEPTRNVGVRTEGADSGTSKEEGGRVAEPARDVGDKELKPERGNGVEGTWSDANVVEPTRDVGEARLKASQGIGREETEPGAAEPARDGGPRIRGEGGRVEAQESGTTTGGAPEDREPSPSKFCAAAAQTPSGWRETAAYEPLGPSAGGDMTGMPGQLGRAKAHSAFPFCNIMAKRRRH